jgi:hypothetical protein
MEGHRFCDTNSRGTYRWKDDAWFFPPVVGWDRTKPPADDEDDGGELFIDGPTSIRSIVRAPIVSLALSLYFNPQIPTCPSLLTLFLRM